MAEKITLEFDINANKADLTLGELKDGMKELETALEGAARGSDEFKKLSTAMAQTNREVKNMELSFEALDNEQVAGEIGSVAGAVGDVSAALFLMGGENETIEQMAQGIQTAMAVSMGFKGAIEGVSSGMKLYNNLLKTGKVQTVLMSAATKIAGIAQIAFNAIMSANPIAIVVLAIAGVITAMISFGSTIMDIINSALAPFQFAIDAVVEALKWLGIMESDSAKATREAEEAKTKAAIESSMKRRAANEELIESHKKLTESIVSDLDFEIRKRAAAGEDVSRLEAEKLQVLRDSLTEQRRLHVERLALLDEEIERVGETVADWTNLLDDKKEVSKELVTIEKAEKEAIQAIEINDIERKKKASDKRKEIRDKETEDLKKAFEARKDIERVIKRENDVLEEEEVVKAGNKTSALMLIAQKKADEDARLHQEFLDRANEEDAARQKQLDVAQAGLDILKNGADAFIKDEVKREKIKKKLAVAQLAVDTARAISGGIAAAAGIPFPGNLIAFAPTIAAILGNIAQAKQLLGSTSSVGSASLGSAGASSSSAGGGVGINPVSNTSTVVGDQTAVVEVVEINNVQNQVAVIEANATF